MHNAEEGSAAITCLLDSLRRGEPGADCQLMAAIHRELRHLAAAKMAAERPGATLQATALVHEAWLRLQNQSFENRAHFFGAAAEAMRRILVDRARSHKAARHGAGAERVDIHSVEIAAPVPSDELLAVHEALDLLAVHDARKAELVKLRYFAGLSFEECAAVLGVSVPTAKRDWSYARAWLHEAIKTGSAPTGDP